MSVRAADESTEMLLADYLEGNLPPNRQAEIDAYLAAHPKERAVIEQLAAQRGLLAALPRESAPPDVRDAVQSQLERSMLLESLSEIGSEKAVGMRSRPQTLALAAMIVLSLGMGVAIYSILAPPSHGPQLADKYAVGNGTAAPTTGSGHGPATFGPVTLSQGAGATGGTTGLDAAVGGNAAAHPAPGAGPFAPRTSATSRPDPFRTPEPEITFARRSAPPGAVVGAAVADAAPPAPAARSAVSKSPDALSSGAMSAMRAATAGEDRVGEAAALPAETRSVVVYVDDPASALVRFEQLMTAGGWTFTREPAASRGAHAERDAWIVKVEPGQDEALEATLRRLVTTRAETDPAAPNAMATPVPTAVPALLSVPAAGLAGDPASRPAPDAGQPSTRSRTPSDEEPARKTSGDTPGSDRATGAGAAKSVRVELRPVHTRHDGPTTAPAMPAGPGGAPSTLGADKPAPATTAPSDAASPTTKPAGFTG